MESEASTREKEPSTSTILQITMPPVSNTKPKLAKAEREALKLAREKERQERQRIKQEVKEKKEAEKQAKIEERKRKEEERRFAKEREEREKQERKEKRELERKKRQEIVQEKLNLKKQRELDLEKARQEEIKKKQLAQEKFRGFFHKPKLEENRPQLPWQPLENRSLDDFDKIIKNQDIDSDYLVHCRKVKHIGGRRGNTNGDDVTIYRPKYKLLMFHENHRPGYYGTYRKKSHVISGRNPYKKDETMLDYTVDSDEEWEEPEAGESLSHSEGEEDDESNSGDDEGDSFFVPHGYLSEGEGDHDDDDMESDKQLAKVTAWEAEFKRKCQPLHPVIVGVTYHHHTEQNGLLCQYGAVALKSLPISCCEQDGGVPEEAMDHLIRLVHKNSMGLKKLISTFQRHWSRHKMDIEGATPTNEISKHHLEQKITSIAHREPGNKWQVNPAVLQQYGLTTITTPLTPLGASPETRSKCSTSKRPQVTIQQFFTPAANSSGKVAKVTVSKPTVARCLSLSPPPAKKPCTTQQCQTTPTVISITEKTTPITDKATPIVIDITENTTSNTDTATPITDKATPNTNISSLKSDKLISSVDKENVSVNALNGIDWTTHLVNRDKMVVPIDVHTDQHTN